MSDFYKYKKYKQKYKHLLGGSQIPSVIYKSLILARFCYEPPVLYLIALGMTQSDFNQIPNTIPLDNLPNLSLKINTILADINKNLIQPNIQHPTNGLKPKYYDPNYIKNTFYQKINQQFSLFYLATNADLNCYILANKLDKTINITFRGTQSIRNTLTDLNMAQVHLCQNNIQKHLKVFQGIFSLQKKVLNTILFSTYYLAKEFIKDKVEIITNGHSLGGAITSLFSYLYISSIDKLPNLQDLLPNTITCVSFGAPKLFNKSLSNAFYQLTINKRIIFYRCVTKGDPITMLPKIVYYHPGYNSEKGKYDPQNTYYFNCAGNTLGKVDYRKPMNMTHTYSHLENLKSVMGFRGGANLWPHSSYLYISFMGAIKHIHTMSHISNSDRHVVCKLILYQNQIAKSFEFIDKIYGNIPNYQDYYYLIIKQLDTQNLLKKKIEGTMKEFSKSYKEWGKKGKLEPILDPQYSTSEILDTFYNFTTLAC